MEVCQHIRLCSCILTRAVTLAPFPLYKSTKAHDYYLPLLCDVQVWLPSMEKRSVSSPSTFHQLCWIYLRTSPLGREATNNKIEWLWPCTESVLYYLIICPQYVLYYLTCNILLLPGPILTAAVTIQQFIISDQTLIFCSHWTFWL